MLLLKEPNNPSGWSSSAAEQQVLLDRCRRTGTWIVGDEVYERLWSVFVQRGALAALGQAHDFVPALVARMRGCRDRLVDALQALQGVTAGRPLGGMYAFFRVDGQQDSLALAKRPVRGHGLGLAPGIAFGPEGEGWLRWCFAARDPARLDEGVRRPSRALAL